MAKRPEHARMKIDVKQILKKKTTEMVRELVADSPKYGVDCANKDTRFKMVQERKAEGLQRVNFTVPRDAREL